MAAEFAPESGSARDHRGQGRWTLVFEANDDTLPFVETLTTIAAGGFGTHGSVVRSDDEPGGLVLAAGVYDDDQVPRLLEAPRWTGLLMDRSVPSNWKAFLDMYRGTLELEVNTANNSTLHVEMFAAASDPGIHVIRAVGPADILDAGSVLQLPLSFTGAQVERPSPGCESMTVGGKACATSAEGSQTSSRSNGELELERIVEFRRFTRRRSASNSKQGDKPAASPTQTILISKLRSRHHREWEQRWADTMINLPEDPDLEAAIRFNQFHLLSNSVAEGEIAIGARGVSGHAYRGHVFWDTDIFVLPALSAMAPQLAVSALRYRLHRLPAARARAAREGWNGARFPWESAGSGQECTPTSGIDLSGAVIPIRTGELEIHITADVAWAVANHLRWAGNDPEVLKIARAILPETARFWQSRIEIDPDGTGHLRRVIGPDEYHEDVDDNAYTNALAAWNLRTAAALCERHGGCEEGEGPRWRDIADRLVSSYDADLGIHEQFSGFFQLEPTPIESLGRPPLAADALVGHDRIQEIQIIKQPDVLMLHHLLPDEQPPGSLARDVAYYVPRTAHGSSLSPAITAANLARVGQLDEAVKLFRLAARLDLDNLGGTTVGGLHLATMGGTWQAFNQGFCGVMASEPGLVVDPRIPDAWGEVTHRFRYLGIPVALTASHEELRLHAPVPITAVVGQETVTRKRVRATLTPSGWEVR